MNKRISLLFLASAVVTALALCQSAEAGNTTVFDANNGQVVLPISPPKNAGATPGRLDNTDVGDTIPAAGNFTTLNSTSGVTGPVAATTLSASVSLQVGTGTKTATASAGAATLNKPAGKITTEALTTAGLADYTLTLTDSSIAAADELVASVANGTNTQGTVALGPVTPGAGSATVVVHNLHATQALNGTLVIAFVNHKN